MGFFSSLFGGSNKALDSSVANSGQLMNFGTDLGTKDLTAGSNFYSDILSGDPTKIGELLGPQISDIQKQGQQQIQTQGEFGNRSGGTNASAQTNMDTQRANVEKLISQLTGQAASGVTGIGESALGTATTANALQANEGEMQLKNIMNSLFGNILGELGGAGVGQLGTAVSTLGSGNFGW